METAKKYSIELTQEQAYAISDLIEKGLQEVGATGNDLDTLHLMADSFTKRFEGPEYTKKALNVTRNYSILNMEFSKWRHELNEVLENVNSLTETF
jgi:hypothetical protein